MLIPLPLLSIRTVNTVTDSNDTSAMLPQCLLVKDRQRYGRRFQESKIFLRFFFCHVHPSLSVCTSAMNNLFRYVCVIFENISLKLIVNW